MNLNKVFIFGNLTRDPELRQIPSGQSVCAFGVATNSFYTDKSGVKQKKTEFHNVVAWGRQAEIISQFLKKGSSVFVEGRLQTRSWVDSQGQNRKSTEIICERVQLGPRASASGQSGFNQSREENFAGRKEETNEETGGGLPEINLDDEDIKPENIPF